MLQCKRIVSKDYKVEKAFFFTMIQRSDHNFIHVSITLMMSWMWNLYMFSHMQAIITFFTERITWGACHRKTWTEDLKLEIFVAILLLEMVETPSISVLWSSPDHLSEYVSEKSWGERNLWYIWLTERKTGISKVKTQKY